MIEQLKQYLISYKKKTIELRDIQDQFPAIEYRDLAPILLKFMEDGALLGGKDFNHKHPPLPKKYRVVPATFQGDFFEELRTLQVKRHPMVTLDAYYKLDRDTLHADLPWIVKIESYLVTRNLEDDRRRGIPLPEASYHMVGNEKWLEEEGGDKVLKRAGLSFDQLGIRPAPEPLMLAVNPRLLHRNSFHHLIVENKTPYHALLNRFQEQAFYSTLIFGRGKMILSSIQLFYQQTGFDPHDTHVFHYFGDLDYEGIGIWHSLANVWSVEPATDMYRKLLQKPHGPGKENHRPQPKELDAFCTSFVAMEAQQIRSMLDQGHYLPQEAVTSLEWESYWRRNDE